MRGTKWSVASVVASLAAILVVVGSLPAAPAGAEPTVRRAASPILDRAVERASGVVFSGRARPRAVVRLQVRGNRWITLRSTRAARNGAYRLVAGYPKAVRAYRVVSAGRASAVRRVGPKPPQPAPVDDCGSRPRKGDGTYWSCTFVDEFAGADLDRSRWLVQATAFSGMTSGNHDCYVDDGSNVVVSDGTLKVRAHRELEEFTCQSPFGAFTTTSTAGTVTTRDRFSQTYGRFEFRARMPQTAGIPGPHSALWLYPERDVYGKWPASGEIDVAEWWSARPGNVYPSVHYAGEVPLQSTGLKCSMATASTAFHLYALEWTRTSMRFYYDGRLCWEHAWAPTNLLAPAPFDRPFNLVITQVWGNLWNAPTSATPTSATIEVDWVKAWR